MHTDTRAADTARLLNARAFTFGRHIAFGRGEYAPHSGEGMRLLAHELTHSIQQTGHGAPEQPSRGSSGHEGVNALSRQSFGDDASAFVIQRYTVPEHLRCDQVVGWLNSNSPYLPEWAETRCDYTFEGDLNVSFKTLKNGKVKATVKGHKGLSVSVDCPVDEPEWSPSARKNRDAELEAWNVMMGVLGAHEASHRRIGEKWRGTLQGRFRAVSFSVTGDDETDAMAKAQEKAAAMQEQWKVDAQNAQSAIDPFRGAVLTCPPSEATKP